MWPTRVRHKLATLVLARPKVEPARFAGQQGHAVSRAERGGVVELCQPGGEHAMPASPHPLSRVPAEMWTTGARAASCRAIAPALFLGCTPHHTQPVGRPGDHRRAACLAADAAESLSIHATSSVPTSSPPWVRHGPYRVRRQECMPCAHEGRSRRTRAGWSTKAWKLRGPRAGNLSTCYVEKYSGPSIHTHTTFSAFRGHAPGKQRSKESSKTKQRHRRPA